MKVKETGPGVWDCVLRNEDIIKYYDAFYKHYDAFVYSYVPLSLMFVINVAIVFKLVQKLSTLLYLCFLSGIIYILVIMHIFINKICSLTIHSRDIDLRDYKIYQRYMILY